MATFGTIALADLLASTNQSVIELGEDRVFQQIEAARDAQNAILRDMVPFAETSSDRRRRYGASDDMTMDLVDEFGRADAQKAAAAANVEFPLHIRQRSVQWTRDAFRRTTGAELAAQFIALQQADVRAVIYDFKTAIFTPTNRTVLDRHVDGVSLAVKALVNADSAPIPLGPNGETFDAATHTHYVGTASFVAADLTALVTLVLEHHNIGRPMVYINAAQEAAVRAFSGFTAYVDARIVQPGGSTTAVGNRALDMNNPQNRAIGIFGAAEVWVKPWMPANYVFAWVDGAPAPLVRRVDPVTGGDLEMVVENEMFPLRARTFERRYGFGAWNRTNGAVLRTNNATYAAPTLTM
jgi:hypothetical protein